MKRIRESGKVQFMNEQSEKLLQKKLLINNLIKNTHIHSSNSFISGNKTNDNMNFHKEEFNKLKALKEELKIKTLLDQKSKTNLENVPQFLKYDLIKNNNNNRPKCNSSNKDLEGFKRIKYNNHLYT